jgi:hypothetical protein
MPTKKSQKSSTKASPRASVRADKLPPVAGVMKSSQVAERLAALGDKKSAQEINRQIKAMGKDVKFAALGWPFEKKTPVWKYTSHAFGYIPKGVGGGANVEIKDAGNIQADDTLKNTNIKITLDRLRVFDYPGDGLHTVLFDFYAQHQTATAGQTQDLHFNQNYRVQEGTGAGITGYPVFQGLKVGNEGVSFKCYTVNVGNDGDKKILGFLDGDVFKKGLELVNTINPVIPVVSGFATGIIKAFATRNDNVPVQDFYMGLDFSGISTRAQLREGSYVAVQVPDVAKWDWSEWIFKPSVGQIVSKQNTSETIPFNYIVFSVSKMQP